MSQDNTLAGASDTTGLPTDRRNPSEAVEIKPIVMYGKDFVPEEDHHLYDFKPIEETDTTGLEDVTEEGESGPKDSSAPASALSAIYEQVKSPLLETAQAELSESESESSANPETPAGADKGSTTGAGKATGSASGSQTSPAPSTTGSDKQSAPSQK